MRERTELGRIIAHAVMEAERVYEFCPGSYGYGVPIAVRSIERAVEQLGLSDRTVSGFGEYDPGD